MGTVVEQAQAMIPGTKLRASGPLLITHWGMSGPCILRLSSYAARELNDHGYQMPLAVNWLGNMRENEVMECLLETMKRHPQKLLSSVSPAFGSGRPCASTPISPAPSSPALPSRLWNYLLEKSLGNRARSPWGSLNRKELNRLVNQLVNDQYMIAGRAPFKDEFVTCGGIDLASVDPATLESKQTCPQPSSVTIQGNTPSPNPSPRIFFAGEVLDIDGITGGFNFQAAWTTAYTVATAISKAAIS